MSDWNAAGIPSGFCCADAPSVDINKEISRIVPFIVAIFLIY
jgi:hypothetical protein